MDIVNRVFETASRGVRNAAKPLHAPDQSRNHEEPSAFQRIRAVHPGLTEQATLEKEVCTGAVR